MEAIANIMGFVNKNEILRDLTIQSNVEVAIVQVSYIGIGLDQDHAIRVVKAV
jgi:hypothetical protein